MLVFFGRALFHDSLLDELVNVARTDLVASLGHKNVQGDLFLLKSLMFFQTWPLGIDI